jgi:hypothetical protein
MEGDADRPDEPPDVSCDAARSATRRLLADVDRVGRLVHDRGAAGRPVPVRPPDSGAGADAAVVMWFVPVTAGERLLGFALVETPSVPSVPWVPFGRGGVEPAARIRRWSTFQRRDGDLGSCPPARDWTDLPTIAATAVAAVGAPGGEPTGEPFLTWERTPEHLVWEVPVGGRRVHVAGSSAWPA